MASPFEILRIDSDATAEEIEQAYRERVIETHPDQGGSTERFRRVREAYEELKSGIHDGEIDTGSVEPREPEQLTSLVEYLNYETLTDHGWALDDGDLFAKAAAADLAELDYGRLEVEPRESLLEAAERHGYAWPYACRGGACANCAVVILEGEMSQPIDHILPEEMVGRGFRLSCNGVPITDELRVVYNVKGMPDVEELLLPPRPFRQAHLDD